MSEATKAGNLDEATAVKAVVQALEVEIELTQVRLAGAERIITKVSAAKGWQKVLDLKKGNVVFLSAEGKWCTNTGSRAANTYDANGASGGKNNDFIPNTPYGALIGQIGEQSFLVGRSASIRAQQDGALELRINDKGFDDNDGELTVTIYLKL
jgi:hypothetical protein